MSLEVIDLCSESDSSPSDNSDEEGSLILSPIKAKATTTEDPCQVIKKLIPNMTDDDYHDPATKSIPVLARPLQGLSVTQLFMLMIGTVPADRICHRKPTSVTYNSVFVVDLSCVRCLDDLRADDNGAWMHGGKPRKKYVVDIDPDSGEVISAVPEGESANSGEIYTLVRVYHHHKSTRTFHRRISYLIDSSNQTIQYAVIQYIFDNGVEANVVLPPHGNSNTATSSSYHRTQKKHT